MNVRTRIAAVVAVVVPAVLVWFTLVASAQPVTIRYAYFKGYDPTFVGVERGYFKQAGVNVVPTGNFISGPASVQGAALGQVDAGLCAVPGLIAARAAGIGVRGIADVQTDFKKAPLQRYYVRADSDIRSVKDLRGKRVGVNSTSASFYYSMLVALSKNGMDKNDVRWVVLPMGQLEQALVTGQVDAIGLIDPFNRKAELDGGVRKLFNAVDYTGERHVSLIFFTTAFMAAHEKAVRAFVRGYQRSLRWSLDNPRAAAGIMWKYIGVEPKYMTFHRYTPRARLRMGDITYWLNFMRQEGALDDGGKLTAASIATIRYTGR